MLRRSDSRCRDFVVSFTMRLRIAYLKYFGRYSGAKSRRLARWKLKVYAPHPLWRTNSPPLDSHPPLDSQNAPGHAPRHKGCGYHHEDVLRRYLYGTISTLIWQVRIEACLLLSRAVQEVLAVFGPKSRVAVALLLFLRGVSLRRWRSLDLRMTISYLWARQQNGR